MTEYVKPTVELGKVSIKINDLDTMVDFYENEIGMDVLKKDSRSAVLGIKENGQELLELVQLDKKAGPNMASGLYHFAIVLPTRRDLGNVLVRFMRNETALTGASFHGYSEALYLDDPEGNGIEIYRDLPWEEWDIREDGQIAGITTYMDAQGVVDAADLENTPEKFPAGTVMGHVHLRVSELEETLDFYNNLLGMDLKFRFGPQAMFFAEGTYHHQVAANVWETSGASKPSETDRGIKYFEVKLEKYDELVNRLDEREYAYKTLEDNSIEIVDPNGITIHAMQK